MIGLFQLTTTISCLDVAERRYHALQRGEWIICVGNLSKDLKAFSKLDEHDFMAPGLWDDIGTPTAFFTSDGRLKLAVELADHPERTK